VTHSYLRASDDDRRRVVAALERHTTAGRLSVEEFSDRVGRAYAAATHGDLADLISDLPAEVVIDATPSSAAQRQLLAALLLAMMTIVILGTVFAVLR
jgi:hypothetical protein